MVIMISMSQVFQKSEDFYIHLLVSEVMQKDSIDQLVKEMNLEFSYAKHQHRQINLYI